MYWLVNVSMNPAGRFGAPETQPAPSGVGKYVNELMRVPFTRPDDLCVCVVSHQS